jgi:N6-adenosine-specific RNA methylase IME4
MSSDMPADLVCLERARTEIVEASYEEAREVRNKAEAVLHYVRRIGVATDMQNRVAEIKLRSERRLGVLLGAMPRRGPGQYPRGETSPDGTDGSVPPSLKELGISRNQSSRWQLIASVPERLFDAHLARMKGSGKLLSSAGVLRLARKLRVHARATDPMVVEGDARAACSLEELLRRGEQFGCVYADPPWPYRNQGTRAATSNHYPTMSLEDIASLPVEELVLPSAHLHLWVTNAFVFEAEFIIRSWGFEPVSSFVWVKPTIGLGNYWRSAHEFLLLGVRGKAAFRDHSVRSWIREPRGEHSKKPEVVRTLIEQVSPGPYLELFGRRPERGWTVFGNQIEPSHTPREAPGGATGGDADVVAGRSRSDA